MAQYKPNSDSFNQLLLELDEHGARANFIDEVLRRANTVDPSRLKYLRSRSDRTPADLMLCAFDWSSTKDGFTYWSDIYDKLGGAYV